MTPNDNVSKECLYLHVCLQCLYQLLMRYQMSSVVCCCCISSAKFFVTVALAHIVLKFSHQGQHVSASLFKTQIWCSKLCEVIVQSCLDDEEQT